MELKPITPSSLRLFWISVSAFLISVVVVVGYAYAISDELPSLQEIENPDIGLKTVLYSANNSVLGSIYRENRSQVSYEELPKHLEDALISTEDRRFYDHSGIDMIRFITAVGKTVINKITGLFTQQGGGTITMQTARKIYTGRAGTIKRKLLEIMTALELERTYSKREILEIFFNSMFYGNNSDGIKTAAKTYFNKTVQDLSIEESATLVGLLQRPSSFNPIANKDLAIQRRNMVLYFMKENEAISSSQFDSLKQLPMLVNRENRRELAPHFNMRLRKELDLLGKALNFDPYVDGLQVFTTLDTTVQIAMDSAINRHIEDIQNQSLRALETQKLYQRYLNNDSSYSNKSEADSAFRATHVVQYGFIVIKQSTGEVMGHLGGRPNYYYDHVFQGERQPGSLIKPFVYTVAINNGNSPSDKILDTPYIAFEEGDTVRWTPDAWDNRAEGLISYRRALKLSKNYAVLHLQDEINGPKPVRQLMLSLGFTSNILPVLSLPLGTNVVKPIEIVQAYGAFGNNGIWVENHTINKIMDKFGNVIYSANPKKKEVLNENTAFIMTSMMQDVVNSGTAGGIRSKSMVPYHIRVAAKTGTTNDHTDIWTMAYTPVFTVCLWLGLDNPKHKINLWSSATVPIVGDFIAKVYQSHPEWEHLEFVKPDGVVEVSICGDNDRVQLANVECPVKITEYFRKEFAPVENCTEHSGQKLKKKNNQLF